MTALHPPPAMQAPSQGPAQPPAAPLVELHGVARRHPSGRGVGPLELAVGPGEVLGLMGPNGAGKTTLLRLMATLDRPDGGALRWRGATSRVAARRDLGVCLDSATEEPTLSARQSTYFWCRQWVADARRARGLVDAMLARFDLDAVADEPLSAFSYGMRRRLVLAQALVHEPELVLLDEPTAGLDPTGVEALTGELRRRPERGQAAVVASNDPTFMEAACDRVAMLNAGRLLRCATPRQLLAGLGRGRRIEVTAHGVLDLGALRRVPGVEGVERRPDGALVRLAAGAEIAGLVAAVECVPGRLRDLRVREPDLRDCFRALAGTDLHAEGGR